MMRHPAPLGPGSTVRVLSPAGPVTPELLEPGLERLRSWDLDVQLDEDTYARRDPGYLAGGDDVRLSALHRALADPQVDAVVFSRGGYGTMRLLEALELEAMDRPKLLVGFSDLTALHLYAAGRRDLATLHAPVVKSLRLHEPGDRSLDALRDALFGRRADGFALEGMQTVQPGTARGPLLGGNLTLLAHMLANDFCPDLTGAILLLEDVGEEDYRLDRMMTALRLSPKTATPAGIVLGDFDDCGGAYVDTPAIPAFIGRLAAEFDCPVVAGCPSGHGSRNVALPMGVPATLEADAGRLEFETDAAVPEP